MPYRQEREELANRQFVALYYLVTNELEALIEQVMVSTYL